MSIDGRLSLGCQIGCQSATRVPSTTSLGPDRVARTARRAKGVPVGVEGTRDLTVTEDLHDHPRPAASDPSLARRRLRRERSS
jgi:hypothetical protein